MMTKKCIRIHAMTHYRKLIVKEMLMSQPDKVHGVENTPLSYGCYICGVKDSTSSYIINHLAIYHKRLDFYNNFVKERLTVDSSKLSSLVQINDAIIYHLGVSNQNSPEKAYQVALLFLNIHSLLVIFLIATLEIT